MVVNNLLSSCEQIFNIQTIYIVFFLVFKENIWRRHFGYHLTFLSENIAVRINENGAISGECGGQDTTTHPNLLIDYSALAFSCHRIMLWQLLISFLEINLFDIVHSKSLQLQFVDIFPLENKRFRKHIRATFENINLAYPYLVKQRLAFANSSYKCSNILMFYKNKLFLTPESSIHFKLGVQHHTMIARKDPSAQKRVLSKLKVL